MDSQSLAAQYATSANLDARIEIHRRCSMNAYGLQRWVFDRLELAPGRRVLEIACGAGSLWRENLDRIPHGLALVLSDFSLGMVQATQAIVPDARFVTCALPALPFDDGAFDLVIANHMLYHVESRQEALRDIRRVLRADGRFFASTNGIEHLREIKQLILDLGLDAHDVSSSFTMENGEAQLREVFASVARDEYKDSLRVTDAEMILRYIASISARASETIAQRGDELRARIEHEIAERGAFQVMKSTGSFTARSG